MKNLNANLRLGFTVAVILLLASSFASYYSINKLIDSSYWVDHSNKVLINSESIITNVKDGEIGQRGYLLTKQPEFLEPYKGSYNRAMAELNELRSLTIDNPLQQRNADSIELLIKSRYAILDQAIEDARNGLTVDIFRLRDGRSYMSQIRFLTKKMQQVEDGLLQKRTAQLNRFVKYAPITTLIATILALLITIFFFRKVMEDSKQKSLMADELKQKDIETTERINKIGELARKLSDGDYTTRLDENETLGGGLAGSLNKMAASLDKTFRELNDNNWLQKGLVGISAELAGEKELPQLSNDIIRYAAEYTESQVGALYLPDMDGKLYIPGGFGIPESLRTTKRSLKDGLAGQCFSDKKEILVKEISEDLYTTFSGGNIKPRELAFVPVLFEGNIMGVIELGKIHPFDKLDIEFIRRISGLLGISLNRVYIRMRLKELLEETQAQSEELQAQHRELENMNAELEAQAEKLQTSEEELRVQQEELMETNQVIEERSRQLEEKNHLILLRNLDIQKQSEELAQSARYKSEFLANMSHELRTPLNSILLLSRLLHENSEENLSGEQMEYAKVIQGSGEGLLQLIDEILDLSKIESGKLELDYERINVEEIANNMRMLFNPMATDKNVAFRIHIDEKLPGYLETDKQRLEQILKNLISNALKFTHTGSIDLVISPSAEDENGISFTVADTGIGIPFDKQHLIFEAFQQADGSTKRKYGGTGLGLSISRQLARLLHGDIMLTSEMGKGSSFALTIPLFRPVENKIAAKVQPQLEQPAYKSSDTTIAKAPSRLLATNIPDRLPDDRHAIHPGDKVLLVVEDDVTFAKALIDYAKRKNYKVVHIVRGDEVLEAALAYNPMGILLDIQLPVKDGLEVIDLLKKDSRTRPIPVHIMSSFEMKKESLRLGAIDFINKPLLSEQMSMVLEKIEEGSKLGQKKVLIVEDNTHHAKALAYFLEQNKVNSEISDDIQKSVDALKKEDVKCVILDMGLPGAKAYEALEIVKQNAELEQIPIIIFTGQSLSRNEEQRIRQYADSIVVKTAHSYQRILSEVSLFLHLVDHGTDKKTNGRGLGKMDEVLKNKTVLVADDDVRNIFALTKALEKHKLVVLPAVDGKEALKTLEANPGIDIVLMDMMMPEMDGYETITRIRKNRKWKDLPVIAVTAKAMSGDREKCMQAGASDYISKPVDTDQLLSLMRVWLYDMK